MLAVVRVAKRCAIFMMKLPDASLRLPGLKGLMGWGSWGRLVSRRVQAHNVDC